MELCPGDRASPPTGDRQQSLTPGPRLRADPGPSYTGCITVCFWRQKKFGPNQVSLSRSRCILRSRFSSSVPSAAHTPFLTLGHLPAQRLRAAAHSAPCQPFSADALKGAPAHPACFTFPRAMRRRRRLLVRQHDGFIPANPAASSRRSRGGDVPMAPGLASTITTATGASPTAGTKVPCPPSRLRPPALRAYSQEFRLLDVAPVMLLSLLHPAALTGLPVVQRRSCSHRFAAFRTLMPGHPP